MTPIQKSAVADLKDWLSYDPATGLFTWLKSRGRVRAGDIAGTKNCYGYIAVFFNGATLLAHRLAWLYMNSEWPTDQIDHINGNRADNQFKNLRRASCRLNSENLRKAKPNNKCGLLGVSKQVRGGWAASIKSNGKRHYLGTFASPEMAHSAYVRAKRELHAGCSI